MLLQEKFRGNFEPGEKTKKLITLAKQIWHWKSEGECVFLSLKDRADQILAVKNVLILNCLKESKVRVIMLCYVPG